MNTVQNRDDQLAKARLLVLKLLSSGTGWTEADLKRESGLSLSMFHETLPRMVAMGEVVVSQGGPNRVIKKYHLAFQDRQEAAQEGPLTPLAQRLLSALRRQGEGARSLSATLGLDLNTVQSGLDELVACHRVQRSQVGMLMIYKLLSSS